MHNRKVQPRSLMDLLNIPRPQVPNGAFAGGGPLPLMQAQQQQGGGMAALLPLAMMMMGRGTGVPTGSGLMNSGQQMDDMTKFWSWG